MIGWFVWFVESRIRIWFKWNTNRNLQTEVHRIRITNPDFARVWIFNQSNRIRIAIPNQKISLAESESRNRINDNTCLRHSNHIRIHYPEFGLEITEKYHLILQTSILNLQPNPNHTIKQNHKSESNPRFLIRSNLNPISSHEFLFHRNPILNPSLL